MTQSEYDTTTNPILKTTLWILSVLALVWVFLMAGMSRGMGGMMTGGMMTGGMMTGRMTSGGMTTSGMTTSGMLVMTLTWLIVLGLIGVLIYLIVDRVRSRQVT